MAEIAWELEHSVEADVSPSFAWSFRTDIRNWNDPPAKFSLEGPFAVGARGTTLVPGQEPFHWCISSVQPGRSFLIEMQLDHATLSFLWRFDGLSERRTRVTQRIELSGSNAGAYARQVQAGFGSNLSDGMQRLAAEMVAAEKIAHHAG
jgi:polyketide cyclase/dehydrase/lipid transport protein